MAKEVLVTFGDSWTFGSELDIPWQQPWGYHLANTMGHEFCNMGTPASGIGHLVVQLFDFLKKEEYNDYKKVFAVGLSGNSRYLSYSARLDEFVNITPEANYRTGNIHFSGKPPGDLPELTTLQYQTYQMVSCDNYNRFLLTQTLFLFENYCKLNGIDVIYFSYFDYLEPDISVNLYPQTITKTLVGHEYDQNLIKDNEYFVGKLFHPNIQGHIRIAEILKEYYDQCYKRD
jgi:hypothetical protein